MTEALFNQVKRKLNITWEDDETTARIEDIINSAIPTLIHKLGITDKNFDFSQSGAENMLFLAYCLYEWNHAVNEFDANYAQTIFEIQTIHQIKFDSESAVGESE